MIESQAPGSTMLAPLLVGVALLTVQLQAAPAAFPPPALLVLTLAILGATAIGWAGDDRARLARWVRTTGLGLITSLPVADHLTRPGLPFTHDLAVHAWAIHGVAGAMLGGAWWPLWLDKVGLGQPVLLYYAPATYLIGGLLVAAGVSLPTAVSLLTWASGALGALTTRYVLEDRGHGPMLSSLVAACFVLAPYRLLCGDYRFALGELYGLALLLPLLHLVQLTASGRTGAHTTRPGSGLVGVAVGLVLCHGLTALIAAIASAVLVAASLRSGSTLIAAGRRLAPPTALAALLAAPVALPALLEQDEVAIATVVPATAEAYAAHAISPTRAFAHAPWDGFRTDDPDPEHGRRMPMELGWLLPLGVVVAAARGEAKARPWIVLAGAAWLVTLGWPSLLLGELPLFRPLQFPWRLLGLATVAALPALATALQPWARSRAMLGLIGALALLDGWSSLGAHTWVRWADADGVQHFEAESSDATDALVLVGRPVDLPEPVPQAAGWRGAARGDLPPRVVGLTLPPREAHTPVANAWRAAPEYFSPALTPLARELQERTPAALAEADVAWLAGDPPLPVATEGRLVLDRSGQRDPVAATLHRPHPGFARWALPQGVPAGRLVWKEMAYPGWQVSVDHGPWQPVRAAGLLSVDIPEGCFEVCFRFTRATSVRRVADALGLMGLTLLFHVVVARRRLEADV